MKKHVSKLMIGLMLLVTILTACSPKTPEVEEPSRMTVAISMRLKTLIPPADHWQQTP